MDSNKPVTMTEIAHTILVQGCHIVEHLVVFYAATVVCLMFVE